MSVRSTLLRTALVGARGIHTSALRNAASPFRFPAMSPTMTEGGIAAWKIKEGDSFSAGDVLLEIETDKATIDVETQDDGVLGKIIKADGAKGIQVGELIGILVEEGDDVSELSADQFSSSDSSAPTPAPSSSESTSSPPPPQESSPSSSSTAPPAQAHGHGHFSHAKPLAPSVSRLLATSSLTPEQVKNLKGSGRDGYLTKGDVLKAMGKIATVWGTKEAETLEKAGKRGVMERFALPADSKKPAADKKPPPPPQDAPSLRRAVLSGFVASSTPKAAPVGKVSFDELIGDYQVKKTPLVSEALGLPVSKVASKGAFDGLF